MNKKMTTMDGNEACATVAYHFTDVSAIYPITPSSPMAEKVDAWSVAGRKNMFGQNVKLVEMESEGGAAGAVHGIAEAGGLATTFTASQGLLLMIPNLHIIAGHRMPSVFHVAARSVAQHANNIFGDHQDVMDCRATGAIMMNSASVQEIMDLTAIAHLTTIKKRIPFIHFFDGFRTSHEIQKIEQIDLEEVEKLVDNDALNDFYKIAMNPEHPLARTTVQGPEVYFQEREANNKDYLEIPNIVENYMSEINRITGRDYHIFNYYGAEDADRIIVIMGSAAEASKEVIDYLNNKGEKVGMIQIHLYRPFDMEYFLSKIPKTVKTISAMDRSIEPGAIAGPVYLDVVAAVSKLDREIKVFGGRYGIASKDVNPGTLKAAFDNMKAENPKEYFTIGINDDVTNLSLDIQKGLITASQDTINCKFWGLGGDGTVGANKNSAKIIGDYAGKYTQAYFEYDSKKSLGVTKSHLRFSSKPIRSTYFVSQADFIACHEEAYLHSKEVLHELNDGGIFLLNTSMKAKEIEEKLPSNVKQQLANKNAKFYTIDAKNLAQELGLGNHTNIILQAAFFKLSKVIDIQDAEKYMKDAIVKTYSRKGETVVNKNISAIDAGINNVVEVEVPESWKNIDIEKKDISYLPEMMQKIGVACQRQLGNDLPVSAFIGHQDGTFDLGTSKYDKRGVASFTPEWEPDNCIQCNQCSFVCPHAAIRSYLISEEEVNNAPENYITLDAKGATGYKFRIEVSGLDCTGCGSCANTCPSKNKALVMKPFNVDEYDETNWEYSLSLSDKKDVFDRKSVKGSQFSQPLLEFSGACAGCGETPYARLLTQLYGEKVYWVNGVGCSLAWGADFPSIPYTTNKEGFGPAFYGTLFEDTAENGLGLVLSVNQRRKTLKGMLEKLSVNLSSDFNEKLKKWEETYDDIDENELPAKLLKAAILEIPKEFRNSKEYNYVSGNLDMLSKKVTWIFGGDGWAYDIGFGGLDHLMASGEDINIFVADTEVYSNTGGQSSKATPIGAVAQFADGGKLTSKKDIGRMMMTYPNTYVASVSMGANRNQLIQALTEAVAHKGPSLVIGYAPCINHGVKKGMTFAQNQQKLIVETGLWPLYRYNSNKEKPFKLDYREPSKPVMDYFETENRYASLKLRYPEEAKKLFEHAQRDANERYKIYSKLEKFYNED